MGSDIESVFKETTQKHFVSLGFPIKILFAFLIIRVTCLVTPIHIDLIISNIWRRVHIMKLLCISVCRSWYGLFYLLTVNVEGYCCMRSHSVTHFQ
jgi:hypothetical protein